MFITKTPFRVSLFGGGTDLPYFFKKEGGQVLGCAIQKYSYITIRDLPPFYDHNLRISYSKIERCKNYDDINHPLIRTGLKDFRCNNVEIHHDADFPGQSGIGSSSSFAVGLAHALYAYKGKIINKSNLAEKAIDWERNKLKEKGGYQDQLFAAYGGFNHIEFKIDGTYFINKLNLSDKFKEDFIKQSLLCYVPKQRLSYLNSVDNFLDQKSTISNLLKIKEIVNNAIELIKNSDVNGIGDLLNKSWSFKRLLPTVSNKIIDDIYNKALQNGAIGGKLLGAGEGGFMLFICKKGYTDYLAKSLYPLITMPLLIDNEGSKLIYSDKVRN